MKMRLNMMKLYKIYSSVYALCVESYNKGSLEKGLMMAEPIVLREGCTTVVEHETPVEMLPCPASLCVSASSVIIKRKQQNTTKSDNFQ